MSRNTSPSIGLGAACASWIAMIAALNLTADPVVVVSCFVPLAVLAVRGGHWRIVVVSLVVGAGLLLAAPGVARVDGSWSFTYADGAWQLPSSAAAWAGAAGGALRIPAQVIGAVLLALVPARLLMDGVRRVSPRSALLAGLAARVRPLLLRDLALVRDELEGRGLSARRGAGIAGRARAARAIWEASISGLLDRAFSSAAALHTRGYGRAEPTAGALMDVDLDDGVRRDVPRDRLLVLAAAGLVAAVIVGRASGAMNAPPSQVLAPASGAASMWSIVAAACGASIGLLAGWSRASLAAEDVTRLAHAHASGPPETRDADPRARQSPREAILVSSVSMRYPEAASDSISDVSLVVAPGELVVLAGASGSGKSTMLDVLSGVAPSATGGVRRGVVRLGGVLAAVLQEPEAQVLVGMVAEEVAFGPRHAGLPIEQVTARVRRSLERLGILHLAQRDCATLSGGELQRVLLAAALALEPAVLLLDEPTSQIDAGSERLFWEAVDELRRELGIAVVAAEHRLDHVMRRADRVVVFDHGRVVADAPVTQLDRVAPQLAADPYSGLAPSTLDHHACGAAARLTVALDRIEVGGSVDRRVLLRGLGFSLPTGAIVTLEGPNGTGKSTLLRAVRGLHDAPGRVLVDGVHVAGVASSARSMSLLAQSAGALLPGRTVAIAAEETCTRLGIDAGYARAALAAAGLADRASDHPTQLSVGERQRLALVAATAHRPPVWLLDEPTRGMDSAARRWVAQHVLAHAAAGGVVLVATHDPALAAAIATHRLRLDVRTGPALMLVQRDASGRVQPALAPEPQAHQPAVQA